MIAFPVPLHRIVFVVTVAVAVAFLLADGVPAVAASAKVYSLKQLVVGSMIPQPVVESAVPFDKRYEELTPEQRDILRADYESLAPDDETPFPANGLKPLVEPLARIAINSGFHGPLVASVDVDPAGRSRAVTIFKSPSIEFTEPIRKALLDADFRPARCKGQPCAQAYVLRLDFPVH